MVKKLIKEINLKETDFSSNEKINITIEKDIMIVNGKLLKIDIEEFIDKFLRITSTWKPTYISNIGLDKTTWSLFLILEDNTRYTYKGNIFPDNYNELKKLLKGVTDELI